MAASAELLAQHAALTQSVGIADLTGRTLLEIRGADRANFLHAFCTNNVKALQTGQSCEAFVTSPQGKTLGHVLVLCEADRLLLDTSPGQAKPLIDHFDRYVISEDVQFVDRTAETGVLLVAGARAAELLPIAGQQRAARVPYVSNGWFFWVAAADVQAMIGKLEQAGALLCGPEAVEAARIEAGFPLFALDITEDNLPQEVGRDAEAISFTKGCYLGQETVARIDALGHVNKKLVGLKFAGDGVPEIGTPLLAGDKQVGSVTSSAWSPRLSAPLALAYIRTPHARAGSQLASPLGPAEVVALPLA